MFYVLFYFVSSHMQWKGLFVFTRCKIHWASNTILYLFWLKRFINKQTDK